MAKIPVALQDHINSAFPMDVCLVGTVTAGGYVQISPRGSLMVYDNDHLAMWERSGRTTAASLTDGAKITVFFRKAQLRESLLPLGGIARFYGTAKVHKSGPVYEDVWNRIIAPERQRDSQKSGFAVVITVERAEDLNGTPLKDG